MDVDRIGKLAGIIMSCGFFVFAVLYFATGKIGDAKEAELHAFYILLIILAGPITYFFANATGDKVELSTRAGKFVIGGGYAVAIAVVLAINMLLPPRHAWCVVTLDNLERNIPSDKITVKKKPGPYGAIYPPPLASDPYSFVCDFGRDADTIRFLVTIPGSMGKECLARYIKREQCPETEISLAPETSGGQ